MEQIAWFESYHIIKANLFLKELQEKNIEYRLEFPGSQYSFSIVVIYKRKED